MYNILEPTTNRKKTYMIRESYMYSAKHINDSYLNLGYKYNGNLIKNGVSPELYANPQQTSLIKRLEGMIIFILEQSKMIKKHFSISHDKNTSVIN